MKAALKNKKKKNIRCTCEAEKKDCHKKWCIENKKKNEKKKKLEKMLLENENEIAEASNESI